MMAFAVVPEIQTHHVVTRGPQAGRRGNQVDRPGAAFPSVDEDRQPVSRGPGRRFQGQQPHAVAAVDDDLAAVGLQRVRAAGHQRPAQLEAGEDRLHVSVAQDRRRRE